MVDLLWENFVMVNKKDKIIAFEKAKDSLIPKNTLSCEGCPYWKEVGRIYLCRNMDNIPPSYKGEKFKQCNSSSCDLDCFEGGEASCWLDVTRCSYLGITDDLNETLLSDKVKICGVGYPEDCEGSVLKFCKQKND